jgi:trigger factor
LKFSINEINNSEREISIELEYEEFKEDLSKEVKKQANSIQLPGFRKGKVPEKVLKSRFGDALEYEASEKVANSQFWKFADENNLKPIGAPVLTDLQFNPGKDLNFKVKFEVIPTLDPKDYTGLDIKVPEYIVTDHEVEHEIDHILKENSTTEITDAVGDDEFFIIKVELQRVTESGEPFEGSKPETLDIDLSNHHVQKEIRDNAKGKKVDESFTFSFIDEKNKTDESSTEEKSTETYHYTALIKEVKKIILPELNEELVKKLSKDKFTSVEQYKQSIKDNISNYYAQRTEEYTVRILINTIINKNDFTPPLSVVQNVLNEMIKQEEEKGKRYGMKKFDKNLLKENLLPSAQHEVKWFMLKDSIQKKEKLELSDTEINDLAAKEAEKTGISAEKMLNYYKSSGIASKLADKKLFDFLKEKNNIIKVAPENQK